MTPHMLFVFSFEQQVAGSLSNAFNGVSGLDSILKGLEGKGPPTKKPMASKKRKVAPKQSAVVAKAVAQAVAKAVASVAAAADPKAVAKPGAAAPPKAVAKAVGKPAAAAPPKAVAKPDAAAPPKAVAKVVGKPGAAAPPKAVAKLDAADAPPKPVASGSRNCVTSRAYKGAKRKAVAKGMTPVDAAKAAQVAYKEAADKWDQENA